ncbi:hypothetical protein AX17_001363 [Amanita inopinata Kibby_2008]|nr:hypothetical protein AX17_001363 [Amanita inopinata Kibby_2008]
MSLVELRVELPAYSRSFNVQIPCDSTILRVKQEISCVCPGNPHIEGQRLVWRGRYLTDDERVCDLWKSSDEPRIVHLAVHPSGWSNPPPNTTPADSSNSTQLANLETMPLPGPSFPYPHSRPNVQTFFDRLNGPPPTRACPTDYIQWKHDSAISALLTGRTIPWRGTDSVQLSRSWALLLVQSHGYEWPTVLDEEFPPAIEGGVRYEQKVVDGFPYLSLLNPTAEAATPIQLHAINVLSYTFSLLSLNLTLPPTTRPMPSNSIQANGAPDVNVLLQQLGLPPLRLQQDQLANNLNNRVLPELPLRPLLAPMAFLIFRTCLLLYFVAPARKPVFGMLILAWMLYEIWQPIRNAFHRNLQRAAAVDDQRQQNGARAGDNGEINNAGGERQQQRQPQPQPHAQPQPAPRPGNVMPPRAAALNHGNSLLDTLANVNLNMEQQTLRLNPGVSLDVPTVGQKLITFVILLVTTTHPAVWNRRRAALRRREGQLRTEANMRNGPDQVADTAAAIEEGEGGARNEPSEGEMRTRQMREHARAEHARRPEWVRKYIERVASPDWVDESD